MNAGNEDNSVMTDEMNSKQKQQKDKIIAKNTNVIAPNNSMLSQVVGILIGSPEFQRK